MEQNNQKTRSALGRAHVPPTKVFRRLSRHSHVDYSNAVLQIYRMGQKNRPPLYSCVYIVLLYLLTFTNNIPCKLKLCPTYVY